MSDAAPRRSCEATLRTELYLEAGGRRFPLAQACHLWVIPEPGVRLPRGPARLVSVIEGHTDRWDVSLGASPDDDEGSEPSTAVALRSMRLVPGSEAA